MRRLHVSSALAISLLYFSTIVKAAPQGPNQTPPAPATSAAYPNSPDGLKQFITDIFAAMESGDNDKASALLSTLEIPDHTAWFMNNFSPAEGPRLDAKYTEMLASKPAMIRGHFKYALADGRTELAVEEIVRDNSELDRAITDAMAQPFPIYSVKGSNPKEQFPVFIGYFFYADAGFRFIDPNVFQALSTAPPLRIRVGGNVQAAFLIHKVSPVYPADAQAKHIEGDVVLHAIIGKDGTIKELTSVSGDPLLTQSAIDAVRQWQYRPYLLNGAPVEVDTTITIHFRL